MELQFLFLPFIGWREYSVDSRIFHVSGPRFSEPDKVEGQVCSNCIFSRKIETLSIPSGGQVWSKTYSYICSKNITAYGLMKYEKHPCKYYLLRGKLKKL